MITGRTVVLGLDAVDAVLLVLTFGMALLTYGSGRTNILLGRCTSCCSVRTSLSSWNAK